MTTQIQTISFNNQSLITFEQNGVVYTAMRPICENIGLEWSSQFNRIKRDEVLNSVVFIMKTTGNDGKNYGMLCLPIQYLNGWLFGIDIRRVKPEIRENLIRYKKECYQVLFEYWNGKPKQVALPKIEQKYTFEFTEDELQQLAWLWFAFKRSVGICQKIYPAFRQLGAASSGTIYSQGYDYLSVLRLSNKILTRITKDFEIDQMTNWRVLKHLRTFDFNATEIDV